VNRKEIHALPGLFFNNLQYNPAVDILDASFLDDLVNGNRSERNRALSEQSFPGLIEVAARTQIHYRIGAGVQCRLHFVELHFHRAANAARADICIDLCRKHPADASRY